LVHGGSSEVQPSLHNARYQMAQYPFHIRSFGRPPRTILDANGSQFFYIGE